MISIFWKLYFIYEVAVYVHIDGCFINKTCRSSMRKGLKLIKENRHVPRTLYMIHELNATLLIATNPYVGGKPISIRLRRIGSHDKNKIVRY